MTQTNQESEAQKYLREHAPELAEVDRHKLVSQTNQIDQTIIDDLKAAGFERINDHSAKFLDAMVTFAKLREERQHNDEVFGYFKSEPFGWTDCAETDEGAIALYESPQQAIPAEPLAYILRNEYNEYRLEPVDGFDVTKLPVNVEIKLSAASTAPIDNVREALEINKELLKALSDLSFDCFGPFGTVAPSIKIYNDTFAVLDKARKALIPSTQAHNTSGVRDETK